MSRSAWTRWGACACACALLLALGAAGARAASAGGEDADKRAEMGPVPFVMGSRYGRSPPRLLAPRNDRFFMGSRYGKRSELESSDGAALWPAALATLRASAPAAGAPPPPLACQYSGLLALYRCRRLYPAPDDRRYGDESNVTEED